MENLIKSVLIITLVLTATAGKSQTNTQDTCSWVRRCDTIQLKYALVADSSGIVRKIKGGSMEYTRLKRVCSERVSFYVREEQYWINGRPVEVILYWPSNGNLAFPSSN